MNGRIYSNNRGAVLILVAVLLTVFIGISALAIDIGHLILVGNELQNAADAGALAGAAVLLNPDNSINEDANRVAYETALANLSGGVLIEINDYASNNGDIKRGSWIFPDSFTPNPSLEQPDFFTGNPDEVINAIEVRVTRSNIPSFFAGIFNYQSFQRSKTAIAYISAPGRFFPGDFDMPIPICSRAITDEFGNVTCNIGRMLNSGNNPSTSNTGGWTNWSQPCQTANPSNIPIGSSCNGGNPHEITGDWMGTTGGVQDNIFRNFRDCWKAGSNVLVDENGEESIVSIDLWDSQGNPNPNGIPDQPWNLTLPVIDCPGNNVANCSRVVGAINISVVWVSESGQGQLTYPSIMNHPTKPRWIRNPEHTDQEAWDDFVEYFDLRNQEDTYAALDKKSIYFLPSCEFVPPRGASGGQFFGVMAQSPVLVR